MASAEQPKTATSGTNGKSPANGLGVSEARSASSAIADRIDQVSATAHDKIDRMVEAARPAAERLADNAKVAVDKLSNVTAKATDTLGATGEQLNEMQDRLLQECRSYVRAKPIAALGVAVLAGFVLSRLFSSR